MQEKALLVGHGETDLGNDLVSQALTFNKQVNSNLSKKSSIKRVPMELGFPHFVLHSCHFIHSLTLLSLGSLPLEWYYKDTGKACPIPKYHNRSDKT
jgi:hypothetical protein